MEEKTYPVQFKGTWLVALIPLVFFAVACALFFIVWESYAMENLAMAAFVGLIVTSLLAKNMNAFWKSVYNGMATDLCAILALILILCGMFAQMMARGGVAQGFVWLGLNFNITGGAYVVFTFIACSIVATATGTSLGTVFSGFPIFYPAGILLGGHPVLMAGAILSGAMFGDKLSPISDSTIASATTQRFATTGEPADIGGVVASRIKYSLVAAAGAIVLYIIFSGVLGGSTVASADVLADFANPRGLIMLIPVAVLLVVAVVTRNIFIAITFGIIVGIVVGLPTGAISTSDIFAVRGGATSGFLIAGVNAKRGLILYLLGICGIMGVLRESGVLDRLMNALLKSKLSATTAGSEWVNALGIMITCSFIGSANGPALIIFGPVADELGKKKGLHPYRRANIIDGMVCSLPVNVPFTSAFIFIVISVVQGLMANYDFITPIGPFALAAATFHPIMLFVVFSICIISGWGREYETKDGGRTKDPRLAWNADQKAS